MQPALSVAAPLRTPMARLSAESLGDEAKALQQSACDKTKGASSCSTARS